MRILHVAPYMSPIYGGPPEAVRAMVNIGIIGGHDVKVYATSSGYHNLKFPNKITESSDSQDIYKLFNPSFPTSWFYSRDLFKELKSKATQVDLLHLHVPFTAPFFMAAEFAIKNDIPFVATLHGLLDKWSMSQKSWKKVPYYHFFEKNHLASARFLHVTSALEERSVTCLRLGIPILNIPLSVLSNKTTSLYRNDPSIIRLLFVGRLHPVKSIPTIFKAIKLLTSSGMNVRLDLAGSGSPSYEAYLKKLIKQYAIEPNVIWHGHVDLRQKESLYQTATFFVMPSLHENFGLAAAEALSAGVPVILSDQVGLAPDVEKWGAGFIIPVSNSEALANMVTKASRSELLNQMSISAKKLVDVKFNSATFSKNLLKMYSMALNQSKL